MTDPRITAAKARLAKATQGPFVALETEDHSSLCVFSWPIAKASGGKRCVLGRIKSPEGVTNEDRATADTIAQALNSHAAALELAEVMTGCRRGVDFCRVCLGDEGPDGWLIHGTDCPVGKFLDTLGEQE